MQGRIVIGGAIAVVVGVVGVAGMARLATAAPPAGYRCGKGGKPDRAAEACTCPADKRPARNGVDEAVCAAKPKRRVEPVEPKTEATEPTCPTDMVPVRGGTFNMGSKPGVGEDHERPRHKVTLSSFCIDRTEVTVASYAACSSCTAAGGESTGNCNGKRADRQDHPVNCVSWVDAGTYCRAAGKRLPTEPEWELAAGGPKSLKYPWGAHEPSPRLANLAGQMDGYDETAPVGSFPDGASPFGALDMVGNVWEWVADEYEPYAARSVTDPSPVTTKRPATDKVYVLRGGVWVSSGSDVRAASRSWNPPSVRKYDIGFRCARGGL